jgi:hypothetical protein
MRGCKYATSSCVGAQQIANGPQKGGVRNEQAESIYSGRTIPVIVPDLYCAGLRAV